MALVGAQFVNAVSPNPVGSLQAYAGASAPTGWLLCDGTSYSTSAYPELYSVLGYTYGGSGANFNVPDLRGRMPMGAGTGAGLNSSGTGAPSGTAMTTRTRGQWGGEETHLNTAAESGMPQHGHGIYGTQGNYGTENGFAHTGRVVFSRSGGPGEGNGYNFPSWALYGSDASAVNASSRHNTVPPFLVTNYIIKAIPDAPRSGLAYGSTPPIVTALPANPQFGDVVTYIADATNGVAWNLQYDATGTYPWKFIGGAPLSASTTSGTSSYSGTSFALAASGNLSVSLPLAGDYWTTLTLLGTNGTAGAWWMAGLSGPGSAAIDQQAARTIQHATGNWWSNGAVSCYRTFTSTGTVEVQYRVTSGTAQFAERGFSLTPVRVKAA